MGLTMNWTRYQQEALTTAVFPPERSVDYTVLGLVSEIAELVEVKANDALSWTERKAAYKKENGDGFWYLAAVADALKCPLADLMGGYTFLPDSYNHLDIPFITDRLTIHAGFMAGLVKKAIRDDNSFISDSRRARMLENLEYIGADLVRLSLAIGSTPEAVTQANLNKLADRKQRGVLQGSGDNR